MKFTKLLVSALCFLCYFQLSAQNSFYLIPAQEFPLVLPNETGNYRPPYEEQTIIVSIGAFQISHQVSLKEYKEFLYANRNSKNYSELMPDSALYSSTSYKEYMQGNNYDDYPVVGVSWNNAMEFCKWKTLKANKGDSIEMIYRLPTRYEWLAAKNFLNSKIPDHDLDKCLADWTITLPKPPAPISDPDLGPDYSFVDDDENSPLERRKIFMGKAGLFQQPKMSIVGKDIYANSVIPNISFRYILDYIMAIDTQKVKKDSYEWRYYDSMFGDDYKVLKKWGLYDKIIRKPNFKIELNFTDHVKDPYEEYFDLEKVKTLGLNVNGVRFGDWYYFDKKGVLTNHVYYNEHGKEVKVKKSNIICEYPPCPKINFQHFVDSIKNVAGSDAELVSAQHITCQIRKGKLDGYFILSEDGLDLKVCGMYTNNMRSGLWATWYKDTLLLLRKYKNSFEFENLYVASPANKVSRLANASGYMLQRNKEGYYEYFKVEEDLAFWIKDLGRELFPEANDLLFAKHEFMDLLLKSIKSGELKAYKPLIDKRFNKDLSEFGEEMKISDIETKTGTSVPEIVKYNIKESAFIDYKRMSIEYRVFGIAPVVKDSAGKYRELFWIYMADARKLLANKKITGYNLPDYIKNYDDLFFFRYYGGNIYKEANVYENRLLSDYRKGEDLKREALRIEYYSLYFELDCIRWFLGY